MHHRYWIVCVIVCFCLCLFCGTSKALSDGGIPFEVVNYPLTSDELSQIWGQGEGNITLIMSESSKIVLWDEIKRSMEIDNISSGCGNVQVNVLKIVGW